ncbi:hypothetical protein N9Z48_00030 [Euryarchaeota archaeon]|nr:hypothetical protein [Euryarchaeota archaeon]MDA8700817.1 hypothetical protein [Euryarchaeota archaeon]MDA8843193.1 hypothetical protein [Euryarchaeota archaeon]MDA9828142.1 hypothetical protein [Candidatus Poseidoniaceae archaeon]MDB2560112.1 hypothetical protein [Euryarchaeota archaeon]
MDGNMAKRRMGAGVLMACLLCLLSLAPLPVTSAESGTEDLLYIDGRVIGYTSNGVDNHSRQWSIEEGQWTSLVLECQQCSAELDLAGVVHQVTSQITVQSNANGTATLNMYSPLSETVRYSLIETIEESFPSVRPAPLEEREQRVLEYCFNTTECIQPSKGHLDGIPFGEYSSQHFVTGVHEQVGTEYVAFSIAGGDTLELQVMHATDGMTVSVYSQNSSAETHHELTLVLAQGLNASESGESGLWHFDESGRVLVKIEASVADTGWAIKTMRYSDNSSVQLIENPHNLNLVGHHSTSATLAMNETQKFTFQPLYFDTSIRTDQLVGGTWILGSELNITTDPAYVFYPYPNISAVRVHLLSPVHYVTVQVEDFSDLGSGLEAPSVRPLSRLSDNSSWPSMSLDSGTIEGEMTLSIHDTADVYKLEVDGWVESEHLVRFTLESMNIEQFELEIWSMDQETWEVIDSRRSTFSNGKIQASLEVGPGTHFLRVALVDATNSTPHPWGEESPSLTYLLSSSYSIIDEGEEPYFPPDENAEKWGVRARFFLGSLFLLPVLYFGLLQYRNLKTAREFSMKSEQLAWFKSLLDSGETTPKQSRANLARALQAVTLLSWDEANSAWGKPDLDYRTDTVAMAVWKLDERIAKSKGAIPLMVGIHIVEGHWDLAALRFDAPVGQAWNVENVEPRFLNRGEEVFLDTMANGNRTFIMAEINGTASVVDIELNGRMNGEPSAVRIPSTLHIQSLEEE